MKKVLLILCDGMRPDAISDLGAVKALSEKSSYTFNAKTVVPSMTLPCHMSLFHSVKPDRHGVTTNVYTPQVRPINGLCEVLKMAKKKCAMIYSWEQLKDITRPGSLEWAYYEKDFPDTLLHGRRFTDIALKYLQDQTPDFMFLYYHTPDILGHGYGWMSREYLDGVKAVWDYITEVVEKVSDEYTVMVTADHGGHDRVHGLDIPEDTTIPLFIKGENFEKGKVLDNVNIIDIAPTVADIMEVEKDQDWEGKSLYVKD
ncbi:MAG: hypothetical protein E7346_04690 [Clostridiales bacterium]|nr:hypothetical protein [Clostridiales bacterium]